MFFSNLRRMIFHEVQVNFYSAFFKPGSADQRESATGSHGVRDRIPKSSNCLQCFTQICCRKRQQNVHCLGGQQRILSRHARPKSWQRFLAKLNFQSSITRKFCWLFQLAKCVTGRPFQRCTATWTCTFLTPHSPYCTICRNSFQYTNTTILPIICYSITHSLFHSMA